MITIENLEKHFISHMLGAKTIVGFNRLSLHVAAGTAVGLNGPSGTGKSSVLKCIYRTYKANAGSITYHSASQGTVDLTQLDEYKILALRQKEIGYIPQFLSVLPRVAAIDIVAEPLFSYGEEKTRARQTAAMLLARLRIPPRLHDAYPCTFSGGEKQRVNFARAVIRPTRLLLLDEPTASLDRDSAHIVFDILSEMKANGTTMIGIFHDLSVVGTLLDDVFQMPVKEAHPCV